MILVRLGARAGLALERDRVDPWSLGWAPARSDAALAVSTPAELDEVTPGAAALLVLAAPEDLAELVDLPDALPSDVVISPLRAAEIGLRGARLLRRAARAAAEPSEELARLATAGRLSAAVAHETRNALAGALSNARFVAEASGVDAEIGAAARDALEGVQRAIAASRAVLETARAEPVAVGAVDVVEAAERAVALAGAARRLPCRLQTELAPVPPALAERSGLIQALLNLILNAVEAAGEGGLVQVRTEGGGDRIRVRVADDGPGIPEEMLGRLFTPFATSKSGGTGLGLAISRTLLASFGGELRVGRAALGGAEFEVELRPAPA